MALLFRQVGAPNTNDATAATRKLILQAQRRVSALTDRPSRRRLPRSTISHNLDQIIEDIESAYQHMPLQRLSTALQQARNLRDILATAEMFGTDLGSYAASALGSVRALLSTLLSSTLQVEKPKAVAKREPPTEQLPAFRRFLNSLPDKGWKVTEPTETTTDTDAFSDSAVHLAGVGIDTAHELLPDDDLFGLVRVPILVRTERPVPEAQMLAWTRAPMNLTVCVVYGRYLTLADAYLLGVSETLLRMKGGWLDVAKFRKILDYMEDQNVQGHRLILLPRRLGPHYYCPLLVIHNDEPLQFREWDILTQP